jgi:hypothetical protein
VARARGPVMRFAKLHVEVQDRAAVTRFGGLMLVEQFCGASVSLRSSTSAWMSSSCTCRTTTPNTCSLNLYAGGSQRGAARATMATAFLSEPPRRTRHAVAVGPKSENLLPRPSRARTTCRACAPENQGE